MAEYARAMVCLPMALNSSPLAFSFAMTLSKGRTGSHCQCARERFEFKEFLGSFIDGAILPLFSAFRWRYSDELRSGRSAGRSIISPCRFDETSVLRGEL